MKKLILIILCFMCALSFVACDKDNSGDVGGGVKTYTIEAEYIDIDDVIGAGVSSEAGGVGMIFGDGTDEDKDKSWSNGYYVGFTYAANLTLDFVFNSDKAETATIIIRLGSEIGDITFDPLSLAVKLNGAAITYTNMFIPGSSMDAMSFTDKAVATNLSLIEGENVISIVVLNNTLRSGQIGGPMIDCVKIKTSAELTWTDNIDNPDRRGEI